MLCTLCQNKFSFIICNYVASTAYSGTVFAFWLFLVINSMYFYHLFRLSCVPQGVPVADKYQMGFQVSGIA